MIFNQFFFSLSYVGIDLFYLLHFIISQRILNTMKKFPEWSLSVTGLWVCVLIDHLCAYRFANSHHTLLVLHIIGSLFYTCSLFYHIPLGPSIN